MGERMQRDTEVEPGEQKAETDRLLVEQENNLLPVATILLVQAL